MSSVFSITIYSAGKRDVAKMCPLLGKDRGK
jgi:hypothetical protein